VILPPRPTVPPLEAALTPAERKLLRSLNRPTRIQAFLDTVVYSTENRYRSPLTVLRERVGHCYDGGVFAAAALRRLGHAPKVLVLIPNRRDDEHMLALFKVKGHWGAVAKSNFTTLRYREPVFRGVRELVMSYFEVYFNAAGEKTLRAYTAPLHLSRFDKDNWETDEAAMDLIAAALDAGRKYPVVTPAQARRLTRADARSVAAGLLGSDEAGLFKLS
jgi:hypothetical protein